MKVLVLGGGVIGVATAYYLARAGHEVEVIERGGGTALETSFANAGQISPGYASPWAGPGVPMKALKWVTMRHGPLIVRPNPDPAMWAWLFRMLMKMPSASSDETEEPIAEEIEIPVEAPPAEDALAAAAETTEETQDAAQ